MEGAGEGGGGGAERIIRLVQVSFVKQVLLSQVLDGKLK